MGYAWVIPVPLVERTLCLVQTWFGNPQKPVFGQIQPVVSILHFFRSDGVVVLCHLSGLAYPFTCFTHPHPSCQTHVLQSVAMVQLISRSLQLYSWLNVIGFAIKSRHFKLIQDKRFLLRQLVDRLVHPSTPVLHSLDQQSQAATKWFSFLLRILFLAQWVTSWV